MGAGLPATWILWDTGAVFSTFFTGDPELIHGINFLPVTPASLYLGRHPTGLEDNIAALLAASGGSPIDWASITISALAIADPAQAIGFANANPGYLVEDGHSRALSEDWTRAFGVLGALDGSVTADLPTAAHLSRSDDVLLLPHENEMTHAVRGDIGLPGRLGSTYPMDNLRAPERWWMW